MLKSKFLISFAAMAVLFGANLAADAAANSNASSKASTAFQPIQVAAATDVAVSDDTITRSAKAALVADGPSATLPVVVSTKQGVISLSGSVPSAEAGDRIVQIVASVAGVKEVRNDMMVKQQG